MERGSTPAAYSMGRLLLPPFYAKWFNTYRSIGGGGVYYADRQVDPHIGFHME